MLIPIREVPPYERHLLFCTDPALHTRNHRRNRGREELPLPGGSLTSAGQIDHQRPGDKEEPR